MRKFFVFMVLSLFILIGAIHVSADSTAVQPPINEVKGIITKKAMDYNIPPEVLKAIAYTESGYKQFEHGEPYISSDGGIGIMQVTPDKIGFVVDVEKLKYDIEYNIEMGAKILDSKWKLSFLPKMNTQDRNVLENWYFPVAAYNGLSKVNDPNLNPTTAYQEKVFKRISAASLLYGDKQYFDFPKFDIRYEEGDETMKFPANSYYETGTKTISSQMYAVGDIVYVDGRDKGTNLRSSTNLNTVLQKLLPYTPLTITGNPVESNSTGNDFLYYPVKGVTANGFASSAYLNQGNKEFTFSDPYTDKRAAALYFLASNGYVTGYQDGSFGSEQPLRREHVAVILDRILDMQMPSGYQIKASDVKKSNEYYEAIAKAEYNGYLGVGGKILPKQYLKRSQMASVLVRAFDEYYVNPTKVHKFKDHKSIENIDAVNKLHFNGITVADPFRPNENVTRSQFALFVYRTMVDY